MSNDASPPLRLSDRDEVIAALRWAAHQAGAQKMATTKLAPGGLARREWRHMLATYERHLERLVAAYESARKDGASQNPSPPIPEGGA